MAERGTFASRLAVAEERIDGQGAEVQRLRERVHLLEGDRAAIRLAVSALRELRREVPKIADAAAQRAVSLGLTERDKREREEDEKRRVNFRDLALLIFAALAVASFLIDHHLL